MRFLIHCAEIGQTTLARIGACPGPTTNAFSREGGTTERSTPDELLALIDITGEGNESTRQAELEPEIAGTGRKVETNDVNLNVREDAACETTTTIAALELTLVTGGGALETDAELSRIATIIEGSEFPWAVATAEAISSESEEDVPAVTATDAEDDEGEEVQAVETKPATKLLLVERGRTMTDSRRTRQKKKTGTTAEPRRLTLTRQREQTSDTKTAKKKKKLNRNTRKHMNATTPNAEPSKATRTCAGARLICKGAADR